MKPRSLALLLRHHQRALWTRPLWLAATGLAVGLLLVRFEVSRELRVYWFGLVAALALLSRFWPRRTLRTTARALDTERGLNNRLEAVVELGGRTDPLAEAARGEVQNFLTAHPLPRPYAWSVGLGFFAALLAVNVAFLLQHSIPVIAGPIANLPPAAAPAPAVVPDPTPPPPASVAPVASLSWIMPEAEISAAPKEEIPLSAETDSKTGLRQVTLHVAINGEARPPLSVPGEIEAGVKPLSLSLLLETFEIQPSDIVTYYLQAELIRPAGTPSAPIWPPVVSPLQVVEIRPLRDDPIAASDFEDPASVILQQVRAWKREQLTTLREAFALGHEGLRPRSDPPWRDLVRAAEGRQTSMSEEIAAISPASAAAGIPHEGTALLTAARTEMQKAAAELTRAEPVAAVAAETKSAALLAAAEKIVAKTVRANRDRRAAEAAASAADDATAKAAELPPRENTPAGRLEKLAAEQQTIAEQLASHTAPPEIFTEQDRVARAISKLAAEPALPKNVTDLLKSAVTMANEAAGQLNEKDEVAATEPATRAAQTLGEALASLEAGGRERAVEDLLAAQRNLNRAATDLQMATAPENSGASRQATEQANRVQQDLQGAARRQQQQGSAEAARQLNELANQIAQSNVKKDAPAAAGQKLRELAQQAAKAAGGLQHNEKAQEQAIAELRRAQANLNRIAGDAARPLHWLNPTSEISAAATDTVPLIAETNSEQGFSRLALQLTVNGDRRPPIAVPTSVGAGIHPVPIPLALENLKVRPDDVVSYVLTAERLRSAADARTSSPDVISSPVQLITIRSTEKKSASEPASGGAAPPEMPADDTVERVRALQSAQRELVERTFTLERNAAARSDPAWQASTRAAETDQRKTGEAADSLLRDKAGAMGPGVAKARALLTKARSEMTAAEAALKQNDPAAGAPAAVRALAALSKILESNASQPGSGAPGPAPGDPPAPGGATPSPGGQSAPIGAASSAEATDLFETVVDSVQRTLSVIPSTMPPPPGPGSTPKVIREYAGLLSQRIEGVIRQAAATESERKRVQVLTTANPSDAPPAYRPAVADYFEKLARDRAAPAPRTP